MTQNTNTNANASTKANVNDQAHAYLDHRAKVVEILRQRMVQAQLSAYIVPSFDAHQSEYVADYFKLRTWLTGFTGSAGTAVITLTDAAVFTDGRYHTQAATELKNSPFSLVKQGLVGEPTLAEWLMARLEAGETVGFDGSCFSQASFKALETATALKGLTFSYDTCLLGDLWEDRPAFPKEPVMDFALTYAGESRVEKIERVRGAMTKAGAQAYIVPNLDDIAWVMNIRGGDIAYCPFVISYLLVTHEGVRLYIHREKLSAGLIQALEADGVSLEPYDSIFTGVSDLSGEGLIRVMMDAANGSAKLFGALDPQTIFVGKGDVIAHMKAVKSGAELENIKNAQLKDGLAMVHFLSWLEDSVPKGDVTELDVAAMLAHFRAQQPLSMGPSFGTIAGYGPNAAMMHYSATADHHATLKNEGFLLFDSGGQYLDGTTDITRTVALGYVSEEARYDYTLTLKSHIGLAQAVFLEGTCGPHLDVLARRPMWENGLDYKCGTGHGLGYVLSVHEGPHTIRCNQNDVPLVPGMLITNEPGVYKPGRHGIRIENTLLVSPHQSTEFGNFYYFETISYCPIDTAPLLVEMLTDSEKGWLNSYHAQVYATLAPHLDGVIKERLKIWTKAI